MPDEDWPSDEARRWLREFEEDPFGWHWMDVENQLLGSWDVTEEPEDVRAGPGHRIRVHPEAPDLYFRFAERDELLDTSIRHLCRYLRELERRLDP